MDKTDTNNSETEHKSSQLPLDKKQINRLIPLGIIALLILIAGRFLIVKISERTPASDSLFGETGSNQTRSTFQGNIWLLIKYEGHSVLEGTQISAIFQPAKIIGSGGCNKYVALYRQEESQLTIGLPNASGVICEQPPEVMDQEERYLSLLPTSATYQIEAGELKIFNESGDQILVFHTAVIGRVISNQGAEIPENATVTITLSSSTRGETQYIPIQEQTMNAPQVFPFPIGLIYNPQEINPNLRYTINVEITDSDGNLLYTNRIPIKVITQLKPLNITIFVDPIE